MLIRKLASAQPLASTNPNSPSGIKSYKGNTHQFYASHYSDEDNPSQVFTWSTESGGNSVMTVSADGLVTLVGAGIDSVTLSHSCLSASYKFKIDSAILPDGTYFLKNKRTEKYVDIYAQNMANGTDIHQWDFHGGNTQRWIFTYLGEGYYTFKSANSSDVYYLGVKNDGTAADTQIVLRTGTITDGMKWKITDTASGAYKITPKTGEPNNRVLAVEWFPASSDTDNTFSFNGLKIRQMDYVEDTNYKDEWHLAFSDAFKLSKVPEIDFCLQYSIDDPNASVWHMALNDSVYAWNSSSVNTNINLITGSSDYTCDVKSYPTNTWYGLAGDYIITGSTITSAKIKINTYTLNSFTYNFKKSTITHEIGHLLGLLDNPPTRYDNESIMNHNRDRTIVYEPQTFDEYNVNFIY